MSGPRLSVALTRDVSPCKKCVRDVEKPQCHDWCFAYWKWLNGKRLHGGLHNIEKELVNQACLTEAKLHTYAGGKNCFAWHISDLKIYDVPLELTAFRKPEFPTGLRYEEDAIKRPPQSWCYVEELK